MIVWDRGEWIPLEDWREGLEKGKLLFELRGYKLHGKWTLVKIKKSEKDEWLLIKERDAYVKSPGDQFVETSVLSGLTVEEVKDGKGPASVAPSGDRSFRGTAEARRSAVGRSHARRAAQEHAFTRDGWLFELKLDGYRLLASKSRGEALLLTRNGNDYTGVFPEIAAVKALPYDSCILDGEVVVLRRGRPAELLAVCSSAGDSRSPFDVNRAAVELPATYFAFDLLAFEDFDLRSLPLRDAQGAADGGAAEARRGARARSHRARRRGVSRTGRTSSASRGSSRSARTYRIAAGRDRMTGSRSKPSRRATS